jgi:hypothetical protein
MMNVDFRRTQRRGFGLFPELAWLSAIVFGRTVNPLLTTDEQHSINSTEEQ